mmetsp:Transcript_269/g.763  ORF Transcript_269/g.763 Transcript_269/m.763 type:complete len:96 (-) Transcript_269:22-309(-)
MTEILGLSGQRQVRWAGPSSSVPSLVTVLNQHLLYGRRTRRDDHCFVPSFSETTECTGSLFVTVECSFTTFASTAALATELNLQCRSMQHLASEQ